MARIVVEATSVTVALTGAEKLEAVHGNVTIPRSAVAGVRVVPDGLAEVHGFRAPGTHWPGVILVGTWRRRDGVTFAVCHGRKPAVVLDLEGARYKRIVVTVTDPQDVLARLS